MLQYLPIKTFLDKAGIYLKVNPNKDDETQDDNILLDEVLLKKLNPNLLKALKIKTLEELHNLLDQAVANEDYETAARLRDEISKR